MAKYPVNTRIIEAVQRVILDRVIKFERKPLPFPGADTCPVNQQIKHGKQHDTGEIRHHSPTVTEKAWSKKIAPAIPLIKISGAKTAIVVREELSMGVTTSLVPVTQARRKEYPRSRYCDIFSVQ